MLTKYDWIFPLFIVGSIHTREIEWAVRDSFLKDVTSEGTKTKFTNKNGNLLYRPFTFRSKLWERGVIDSCDLRVIYKFEYFLPPSDVETDRREESPSPAELTALIYKN